MVTPDARLLSAAAFVRPGAIFADIGTDHAYLPIYLVACGRVRRAIAADIGEGPLARARAHIRESGCEDRVRAVLTDGLSGLEHEGLTDIAVCGMGGELIARILEGAPFVRDPSIRLILQPMTRPAALRTYLAANGFCIEEERLCRAAGRVYSCLCASYDGRVRTLSPAEAEIGDPTLTGEEDRLLFAELIDRRARALRRQIAALCRAGQAAEEARARLAGLLRLRGERLGNHEESR